MPNPFVRKQAATSTVDVDRPTSLEPVPERVQGPVFPYRGMETHGVDPGKDWRNPEEYDGYERGVTVDFEEEKAVADPIPVFIVEQGGREIRRTIVFRSFATGTTKGGGASHVVSSDFQGRLRRSAKVKNLATTTVYIGTSQEGASVMHGWPLVENEVWETTGEEDIWAIGTAADESPLAVTVEYSVVVNG